MKPAIATINSAALRHNIQLIKSFAPNQKLLAMIKANAYGQGLLPAAHILADQVDGFGVARLREALEIQETGYTGKILLVEGFFDREELLKTLSRRFDSVIHCYEQLELLEQVAKEWEKEQQKGFWKRKTKIYFPINVWLKIDTGMHRLGVHPEQVDEFYQRLKKCPLVESISFVSHFSRADELDCGYTEKQISTFEQATQSYPEHARSISASSGILYWKQAHLIAVRTHKAGEPVGYGGTWVSPKDTKLGVIAMGYGDGYPRNAPEGTPVLINGRKVPIVGRVSMDMLTVDLGADSQDKVGDEAIFWGKDLLIEEIAEHIGVISYELITKLTPRVIFEYQ